LPAISTKPSLMCCILQISDPDEGTIFDEKISVGAKARELEHKVEKRGVYEMCFELHDGKIPNARVYTCMLT